MSPLPLPILLLLVRMFLILDLPMLNKSITSLYIELSYCIGFLPMFKMIPYVVIVIILVCSILFYFFPIICEENFEESRLVFACACKAKYFQSCTIV